MHFKIRHPLAKESVEDVAAATRSLSRDKDYVRDRAGVDFWNRQRASTGNGNPSLRSKVKRVLDVKIDRMFRSLILPVPKGGSLLEIGCAPGWILARIGYIRPDLKLHGIDYALRGVDETRSFLSGANIAAEIAFGDLREYSKESGFDVVVSAGLLEHYDSPVTVVAHHARIAGIGNLVLVTVPNFATPMARDTFRWSNPDAFKTHNLDVMCPERLADVFHEAGLAEIDAGYGGGSQLYVPSWRGLSMMGSVYYLWARIWNTTFAILPRAVQPWNAFVWARGRVTHAP